MNRPLTPQQWRAAQSEHQLRAKTLTQARRERRQRGEREPVDDFMFEYYPYTPTKLETWYPGVGVSLEVDQEHMFDMPNYLSGSTQCNLDPAYVDKHRARIDSTLELLRNTSGREGTFNCFGLHEWAMLYKQDDSEIRHLDPLRVSQREIAGLVEEVGLRCTHIDAFRFFTEAAAPQNANRFNLVPTRENQKLVEQPGCLHANMDLYKHCMWFQPMITGALVLDCFVLARDARTLDMQASPYDLLAYGYEPIRIEEGAGRATYVARQRLISQRSDQLRNQLISVFESTRALST
ncbi:MAG: 3-methyladenine DNA glycosylase [Actinomycetia bacterium]|nr:3-methyladenine DNA glycosylase [Actinomycetes bacterium]